MQQQNQQIQLLNQLIANSGNEQYTTKSQILVGIVVDNGFSSELNECVQFMLRVLRLIRFEDCDEPILGKVYDRVAQITNIYFNILVV